LKKENFIYGYHPVMEAIEAGKEIDKVLIRKGNEGMQIGPLIRTLKERNIPYQFVPVEKLNYITRSNHQGIIAFISQIIYHEIESIIPFVFDQGRVPLILLLDNITDVRNLGAIARTAECMGVDALVVPLRGGAQINEDAVKTSAGALNRIPVCKVNSLKQTVAYLKQSGLRVFSASEKASKNIAAADLSMPLTIIMGSEDEGISESLLQLSDEMIKIPMQGNIASLNVSVATGMILYEVQRQRG
jgi:23S rRNA (guanosine2251-2'-O)-methyltransferase